MRYRETLRDLGWVLVFGLLTLLLARIEFTLPGLMGLQSNFAEVALIASLLYVRSWPLLLLLSCVTVFNVGPQGQWFPESINHVVGMAFLVLAARGLERLHQPVLLAVGVAVMVTVYYFALLVPIVFALHALSGTLTWPEAWVLYQRTVSAVSYEWTTTTAISVLVFLTHRESIKRLTAQAAMARLNGVLEEKVAALQQTAFVDQSTGFANGLQLERDIAVFVDTEAAARRPNLVLAGFRLDGLASLNQEVGLEQASQTMASILKGFASVLDRFFADHPAFRWDDSVRPYYRIDATVFVFLMRLPTGMRDAADLFAHEGLASHLRAELVQQKVKSPLAFFGGITFYPDDTDSVPQLVRNLLNMLHTERLQSRGTFFAFNPEQYSRFLRVEDLRHHLPLAIANREFSAVFQPKVDATTRRLVGFEALARWTSPLLGPVSPAEFIPVAERFHHIEGLTRLILDDVLRFCGTLSATTTTPLRVAINISSDLLTPSFCEEFLATVGAAGLANRIEVEITESLVTAPTTQTLAFFAKLRQQGITIAIDDFGTGYSNLVSLQNFEPDVLKVDKTFVDRVPADQKNNRLVRAILDMGRALEVEVVAEGVETEEQLRFLQDNGCTILQGYLFAKPLAPEAALTWARELGGSSKS